jgi:hypothetical protein
VEEWKNEMRKKEVRESSRDFGVLRLCVHHYIGCGETWLATCYGVLNARELKAATLEGAQKEATALLRSVLNEALREHPMDKMEIALSESVKLQSHYAALLNQYDGGERLTFKSSAEWIERLEKIGVIPPDGPGSDKTVTST